MSQRIFFNANAAEMLLSGYNTAQLATYLWGGDGQGLFADLLLGICYIASMSKMACGWATLNLMFQQEGVTNYNLNSLSPVSVRIGTIALRVPEICFHAFLLRRVYTVSGKNKWVTGIGLLIWMAELAASIGTAVWRFKFPYLSSYFSVNGAWLPFWTFSLVACDAYLSSAFCICILRSRRGILDARLSRALRSLISVAVQGSVPTFVVSLITACLYITHNGLFLAFQFLLPPLYTACFLSTLNARRRIRNASSADDVDWVEMTMLEIEGRRAEQGGEGGRLPRWGGRREGAEEEKGNAAGSQVVSFGGMFSALRGGPDARSGGSGGRSGTRSGGSRSGEGRDRNSRRFEDINCEVEVEERSEQGEDVDIDSVEEEADGGEKDESKVLDARLYVNDWAK
ncbi:hypothetical protein JCM8547_008032 [Rhodosporidiobolus lusitaniae]